MSQFAFLQAEWSDVYDAAALAEAAVHPDPRTACFYARRALELLVHWVYKHDSAVVLPYQDNLGALVHEPTFRNAAGQAVFNKAKLVTKLGNNAVHSQRAVAADEAVVAVRELFHVGYWLAHTYATGPKPPAGTAFYPNKLPTAHPLPKQTVAQLQQLETQLQAKDEKLSAVLADKDALDAELARLRAEIAAAKKANTAHADTHDYSEAETRDYFIDLLLKEAGWPLDQPRDREYEVAGMPNTQKKGYVDYVLWGDDGLPLALVEAKRTRARRRGSGSSRRSCTPTAWRREFGRRPVIFYSNGYDHWLWDDTDYPPRAVQGFYKKAELELLVQRRASRKPLAQAEISGAIVERYYQTRAIRRIGETFETDKQRKALVVMATGAGKTRTVIALVDLLMRCNWAKRVLFLADRVALVNQAANAFKKHLPDAAPVNLVTEKDTEGRVFVSTYPTMMGLIDDTKDGQRRFGVGHFDLVVIDEAHRSVFQKYRAIFDYFDALLVGLTATPKDETGPQHVQPVRPGERRPHRRVLAGGRGEGQVPGAGAVGVGAGPVPARGHLLRRPVRSGEGRVGRAGVGRGRRGAGVRGGAGGEQVALQRGHGGQGARTPDDRRAEGRRRGPPREDHHLRQEPGARATSSKSGSTSTTRT